MWGVNFNIPGYLFPNKEYLSAQEAKKIFQQMFPGEIIIFSCDNVRPSNTFFAFGGLGHVTIDRTTVPPDHYFSGGKFCSYN